MEVYEEKTIPYAAFSEKQINYLTKTLTCDRNCAEGSIRSGKTILHCLSAFYFLESCPDKIHLATGSTVANAKMNIGDCNGFGLEHLFRGRCRWGVYRGNEALIIDTKTGKKVVVFAGGGKADSYKKILGNSYGLWIATEINLHYDSDDSETSFIKVALGRQIAAKHSRFLWDLNPSNPNHKIYKDYIDKWRVQGILNYEHFTLADNLSITPERRKQIEFQYDPNSVWYKRDILGLRCVSEGLIYQEIADNPRAFMLTKAQFEKVKHLIFKIEVGVDFGGNGSKHTFVANAYCLGWSDVITLKSKRIENSSSLSILLKEFVNFAQDIYNKYSKSFYSNYDSAEVVLGNSLQTSVNENHLHTEMLPALKTNIINRIRLQCTLLSQGRYWYLEGECDTLINALVNAQWDQKKVDTRLDNGTSDIDSLDAHEYSMEKYTPYLLANQKSKVRELL